MKSKDSANVLFLQLGLSPFWLLKKVPKGYLFCIQKDIQLVYEYLRELKCLFEYNYKEMPTLRKYGYIRVSDKPILGAGWA